MFGIPVVGCRMTPDAKLIHAATVMAEYLDNDEDGEVDDPAVLKAMKDRNAMLVMFASKEVASNVMFV